MTELFFYHLEQHKLERVLPLLLAKTLERGWKAVVECASQERADALDAHLWTYADDSFLPHGLAASPDAERQPVLITTDDSNANKAEVRFFVDGARPANGAEDGLASAYQRLVYLFDGRDPAATQAARTDWKALRDVHDVTYWKQDANGRWEKQG